ncbi:MAG: DUF4184 family protein [Gemmatimonadaceae bacterium]|nr:DUF4184 family protein [Gemmatimonadaceae bacterium]
MPATILSHQALVLPLKLRWPRHFSGLALVIGSMAPDLEFIGRMADDWLFSHTLLAQFWFTVPVTMLLTWLLPARVFPVLLPFLRDHSALRLHDLSAIAPPSTLREWLVVASSAWVGGVSHVVLDGITHGNHSGWLVPHLPMLRMAVPHFGGPVPLHDALQLWLTIGFALVTAFMWRHIAQRRLLWQWRARHAELLPRQPKAAGHRILAIVAVCTAAGALLGMSHPHEHPKAAAAAVAFGAIDVTVLGLVTVALALRRRAR